MSKRKYPRAPITVRRMDFDFEDVPRYWADNSPFLTHVLNALTATFPAGERFFVDSVRHFRDRIGDADLRQQVSAFIGQEAMHAKEHDSYNRYATRHGIDLAAIEDEISRRLDYLRKNMSPERQLAVTCAMEHFTAIMAEGFLNNPEMFDNLDPAMAKLWLWHAVEENEHKAVAYDVYQQQVGDYWLRVRVMLLCTTMFLVNQTRFQTRLLRNDGELRPLAWLKGVNRLWGRKGWFRAMIPAYFEYYRPDFHPWQHDTRALLEKWKKELSLDNNAVKQAA